MFKEGWDEVADEPQCGDPSSSNIEENVAHVQNLLELDHRLSVWKLAETCVHTYFFLNLN